MRGGTREIERFQERPDSGNIWRGGRSPPVSGPRGAAGGTETAGGANDGGGATGATAGAGAGDVLFKFFVFTASMLSNSTVNLQSLQVKPNNDSVLGGKDAAWQRPASTTRRPCLGGPKKHAL